MGRTYKGEVSIWPSESYNSDTEKVEGKWTAHIKAEDSYPHDEGGPWERDIYGEGKSIMEALQDLSRQTKFE